MKSDAFLFTNKPSGILTHSDGNQEGWAERLSEQNSCELKVIHRLDKETSGALVFAKNKEAAQRAVSLFTNKDVQKTYLFITDQNFEKKTFTIESHICKNLKSKNQKSWKSSPNPTKPSDYAKTHFEHLKSFNGFHLFQAKPITGKTHQIRLHAKDAGIPILGDTLYGGTPSYRIMLHAQKIESSLFSFESPPPLFFTHLELFSSSLLISWLNQLDFRQRTLPEAFTSPEQTLRLMDNKDDGFTCDKLGDVLWFYRFRNGSMTDDEQQAMQKMTELCHCSKFFLRQMDNRGLSPKITLEEPETTWVAQEQNVKYLFAHGRGWSPGLFLDQRKNRAWVKANSHQKKILNLFSYTGAFSLNAALAGASEVVSVDTSQKTLDWSKENFQLNGLNPEKYEFWAADARFFLKGCIKRKRKFDIIICDPPSFARNKKSVFKLEDEASFLIEDLISCLSPNGSILFSCNLEKWPSEEIFHNIQKWIKPFNKKATLLKSDWDFYFSDKMKSFMITSNVQP